jgi:hypothetical protein
MNQDEKQMLKLYDDLYLYMGKHLSEKMPPLAVAAVMMTTALRLYKTTLSPEDYEQMMNFVSDSRDKIQKFGDEIDRTLN